ncbi:MAG: hypothetical protein U0105_10845 [Candidatus Obscuribacterales bacterium]
MRSALGRLRDPAVAQKVAIALLISGLGLLLVEVRFEHQVVLAKKWQSWIPLIYTTAMLIAGGIALPLWKRGGRIALLFGFAAGVIVGSLGFWFHSKGLPFTALCQVMKVICMTPGKIVTEDLGPPVLAPLSLIGLGLLGVVLCLQTADREASTGVAEIDNSVTLK